MNEQIKQSGKGGRKPKKNPCTHRYVFRLTDEENAKFLSLFEASALPNRAKFIVLALFERPIKTVKVDVAAMDYYMRLTTLYGQFRSVGVNYNQVVKILYRNFSEKKASAYLFKLEKQTVELSQLCKQIMLLTERFKATYLETKDVK